MTAQTPYDLALALMDEVGADITEEDTKTYEEKAPQLITLLQREIAHIEGVTLTGRIESLESVLEISDDSAERIMPYGLAAKFALADNLKGIGDDYKFEYEKLKRTIRLDEEDITDEYNILSGMG